MHITVLVQISLLLIIGPIFFLLFILRVCICMFEIGWQCQRLGQSSHCKELCVLWRLFVLFSFKILLVSLFFFFF